MPNVLFVLNIALNRYFNLCKKECIYEQMAVAVGGAGGIKHEHKVNGELHSFEFADRQLFYVFDVILTMGKTDPGKMVFIFHRDIRQFNCKVI